MVGRVIHLLHLQKHIQKIKQTMAIPEKGLCNINCPERVGKATPDEYVAMAVV
jgi:hypothetical protein